MLQQKTKYNTLTMLLQQKTKYKRMHSYHVVTTKDKV